MGMSRADYLIQLQALLPQGPAWPREPAALLTRLLDAFAEEFARIDARADQLIDEADPRTTYELLADWERVTGLPGTCALLAGIDFTVEQRRAALVTKLTERGGQSRAYFIAMAADLGYLGAAIEEYRPMTCNDTCNDALWSDDDRFAWTLQLPSDGGIFLATCNSPCDSPLAAWGNDQLECAINEDKPAHTTVLFAYV